MIYTDLINNTLSFEEGFDFMDDKFLLLLFDAISIPIAVAIDAFEDLQEVEKHTMFFVSEGQHKSSYFMMTTKSEAVYEKAKKMLNDKALKKMEFDVAEEIMNQFMQIQEHLLKHFDKDQGIMAVEISYHFEDENSN